MTNKAIAIFDNLLSETKDYTVLTVIELLQRLAFEAKELNVPFRSYMEQQDVENVLQFAINVPRMRAYTGKRLQRSINDVGRMLVKHVDMRDQPGSIPVGSVLAEPYDRRHEPKRAKRSDYDSRTTSTI